MAGTIFGIPLSQRVDLNGLPSVGWLLYLYQANTSTPVNSYQDTALTLLNPWPIPADAYGMMRQFWLADGSYRARATSADGSLTYFDQLSILALGASSGAAPSGGVDATTVFQTGDVMWLDRIGLRTGWVRDNGNTIGSATSGANEPGGNVAGVQPLFEFLWNSFDNTICPVLPSRGASSLADWLANKRIATPDKRGCSIMGADQMGAGSSGMFTTVPIVNGGIDAVGSIVGGNNTQLSTAQMPSHSHTGTSDNESNPHTHSYSLAGTSSLSATAGGGTPLSTLSTQQTGTESAPHTHTFTSDPAGSDAFHNNVPRSIIGTFYRKL